jgi:hypothetical protein
VFLNLQQHIQSSLAPQANQNLVFTCVGPNTILQIVVFLFIATVSKALGTGMRVVCTHEKDITVRKPVAQFELESATYLVISFCKPIWIQVVLNISDADIATQEILTTLMRDGTAVPHFSWKQGLLRYPTTICMGVDPELQNRLLIACLSSAMGGQSVFGCFPMEALYGYKNQDDEGRPDCEVHRTDQVANKLVSYFLLLELSAEPVPERVLQRRLVSCRVTTMLQVLIKSPIQNICDIVLHNTDAEGWVQFAEDEILSVTMFEKPPWTNGNAQRLGDKPPFKEGGMSVPMGRVSHLGLGPACVVVVGWIRGATSSGEKASKDNYQQKRSYEFIPVLLFFLCSSNPLLILPIWKNGIHRNVKCKMIRFFLGHCRVHLLSHIHLLFVT